MNISHKILLIMGVAYILIGGIISVIFFSVGFPVPFIAIPMIFVVLGLCFVTGVYLNASKKKRIVKRGKRYPAKIYGYVENTSYRVNGTFTVSIKVHYFDDMHIEREVVLPAGMPKGSGLYPIGMTIDIFEYKGKFGFDPQSVRNEVLEGERELMDDKPVSPDKVRLVAVNCPCCGSSFQAAHGYSSQCPYCGRYLNV